MIASEFEKHARDVFGTLAEVKAITKDCHDQSAEVLKGVVRVERP